MDNCATVADLNRSRAYRLFRQARDGMPNPATQSIWRLRKAMLVVWCAIALAGSFEARAAAPSQTFELREWFGVNHPEQIVEFDLNHKPQRGTGILLDERDMPVQFQLLEDGAKLALRTDLRANARRSWRWFSDENAQTASVSDAPSNNGVRMSPTAEGWEISNGLVAFRVPSADAIRRRPAGGPPLKPLVDIFNHGPDAPRVRTLAPIQGVRLRDGTWTAVGPNALVALATRLSSAEVELLETGPLKASVRVRYDFAKPAYAYGQQRISEPGPGYLVVTLVLYAGQPSILLEEETDLDEVWAANFFEGLAPDEAQYRGHHSTDPKLGHMADGSIYLPTHVRTQSRGAADATVELQYQKPQGPSYVSSAQSWRFMAVWDPWIFDGGWYWQLYNSAAGVNANVVSIFAGPVSRALSPAMSGAGIFTLPATALLPGKPVAGISSQSYRRSPDARISPRSRFAWGIFLGVKGRDLAVPEHVPTVNVQSNLFGGPVNLTKLAAMKLDFADPPQGYGGLYMPKSALDAVIQNVRKTKNDKNGLYRRLYDAEPTSRALFDAWADDSGAKMRAAAEDIVQLAHDLADDLVNGHGIYSFRFHYWMGGLEMMRRGLWIDQVLASDKLAAEQRARVKAAASFFAYVLWDNDFVPMDNWEGFNLGTANMPQQQQGYRYFYATLLANHPGFAARARLVQGNVLTQVQKQINDQGAHFGAPHYISASFAPTLNTLMQVKELGRSDPFREEPRLAKFAEFYLNLLTPPEVRFPGQPRSYIALGDSSTEASPLYGQLGTAFRDADPALSRRLMAAWRAGGKPHSGFFGTTVMAIDDRLPGQDPDLGSATFPGYYSVLRSGWNTTNETAAWVVNGDFYSDHRANDAGGLVLYALGVPISVHWGSIYYPQAAGAYYQSTVVPESALGRSWNAPAPPPDAPAQPIWHGAFESGFSIGETVDTSVSKFAGADSDWMRTLQLHHADPSMPVVVIRDDFSGTAASAPKILTLNLLAKGPVQTPAGPLTPEAHTHPFAEKTTSAAELPSAGQVFTLRAGVSRLSFSGQFGVDFDLFILARGTEEALIGNWADTWTQQSVPKWQERQHILRIRGGGPFHLVLVPYRSGHRPPDLNVEIVGDRIALTANGATRDLVGAAKSEPARREP